MVDNNQWIHIYSLLSTSCLLIYYTIWSLFTLKERTNWVMGIKKIIWVCIWGWASFVSAQSGIIEPVLTAKQLNEDLDSLYSILVHTHSDPYAYTSPESLAEQFEVVRYAVREGMTPTEFYKLVNPLFIQLRDIHSRLYLSGSNNSYALNGGYFLPLRVRYLEEKLWVSATKDSLLPRGSEVLAINGVSANQIVPQLLAHSYTDGEISNTRQRVMEEEFFSLFPLFFPVQSKNEVSYIAPGSQDTLTGTLKGVRMIGTKTEMKLQRKRRRNARRTKETPYELEIRRTEAVAILTIHSFSEGSGSKYERFIKQSFSSLRAAGIQHLIIDLRGNKGGYIDRGTKLISQFATQSYPYISHSVVRSSPLLKEKIRKGIIFPGLTMSLFRGSIGKEILAGWENPVGTSDTLFWEPIEPIKPEKRFDGDVYLLVDGLSISNSSLVHHAIKANSLGVSIGTPCGGTSNGTFGNSAGFLLPYSRISGKVSTIRIQSDGADNSYQKESLAPDYLVPVEVADFISEKDAQLHFALELIRKKVASRE